MKSWNKDFILGYFALEKLRRVEQKMKLQSSQELFQCMISIVSGIQSEEKNNEYSTKKCTLEKFWAGTLTSLLNGPTLSHMGVKTSFIYSSTWKNLRHHYMVHFWYNIYCWKSENENTVSKLSFPASMKEDILWLKLLSLELLIALLVFRQQQWFLWTLFSLPVILSVFPISFTWSVFCK